MQEDLLPENIKQNSIGRIVEKEVLKSEPGTVREYHAYTRYLTEPGTVREYHAYTGYLTEPGTVREYHAYTRYLTEPGTVREYHAYTRYLTEPWGQLGSTTLTKGTVQNRVQ